jgi:hypothetical protein
VTIISCVGATCRRLPRYRSQRHRWKRLFLDER